MILSCKSCEKKFVVPDNAIGASGRLVQCSSCGNKWKQFPVKETTELKKNKPQVVKNLTNIKKTVVLALDLQEHYRKKPIVSKVEILPGSMIGH